MSVTNIRKFSPELKKDIESTFEDVMDIQHAIGCLCRLGYESDDPALSNILKPISDHFEGVLDRFQDCIRRLP